ncbi:putative regulator of septum formation [Georgenia soli]|uniref:Putative regulator of septum formation n=1 Tax=Georgenia soli TaxID=638953 RepID=A0A2A9ENU9_9MICO|nr:septum formation family protein [Georgenia soli]PFG40266.1 putative regulator of septum formation [Georgenia soli]
MRARALPLLVAVVALMPLGACSGGAEVVDLKVGDCLDKSELGGTEVTSVETKECSEPHDAEVFGSVTHADGDYPGRAAVEKQAEEECTAKFEEFVGVPYAESKIYFSTLSPTKEGWDRADDRTSLCILLSDKPVSESLKGAAR